MLRKVAITKIILFTLFLAMPVMAATDNTSQIPELNPFCWHRKDCQNIRKQFGGTGQGDEGFISDASVAPCVGGTGDDQWGRCLPAGTSKTEISFGGKSEFSNIGEFIVLMYKYLLTIASIVAVVVIIIAGMQWVTSGGNSEAIGSAKKRIGGAVIGLFIAYMSYFVLNTINPALVNLRLPQVWLIRPKILMTEFCGDLPGATTTLKFAKVSGVDEPNKPLPPAAERDYIKWETMACGSRFLVENGGEQVCKGNSCDIAGKGNPEKKTCFDIKGDGTGYECGNVRIAGRITYNKNIATDFFGTWIAGFLTDEWDIPPIVGNPQLFFSCNNDVEEPPSYFLIPYEGKIDADYYTIEAPMKALNYAEQFCNERGGGLKGFAVKVFMNQNLTTDDEDHYLGSDGGSTAIDLGQGPEWVPSLATIPKFQGFFFNNVLKIDKKYFISIDQLKKGFRLNIEAGEILDVDELSQEQIYHRKFGI
jgi:hypothetical protein